MTRPTRPRSEVLWPDDPDTWEADDGLDALARVDVDASRPNRAVQRHLDKGKRERARAALDAAIQAREKADDEAEARNTAVRLAARAFLETKRDALRSLNEALRYQYRYGWHDLRAASPHVLRSRPLSRGVVSA